MILVELTVCDESNFSDQVDSKEVRYNRELSSGWQTRLLKMRLGVETFGILWSGLKEVF